MAHFHLPGRAFSIQFPLFWWILATVLITTSLLLARRQTITAKRFNIAAMVAAAPFAIFQVTCSSPVETWLTTLRIQKE